MNWGYNPFFLLLTLPKIQKYHDSSHSSYPVCAFCVKKLEERQKSKTTIGGVENVVKHLRLQK